MIDALRREMHIVLDEALTGENRSKLANCSLRFTVGSLKASTRSI